MMGVTVFALNDTELEIGRRYWERDRLRSIQPGDVMAIGDQPVRLIRQTTGWEPER
jgi:hypothetical protein